MFPNRLFPRVRGSRFPFDLMNTSATETLMQYYRDFSTLEVQSHCAILPGTLHSGAAASSARGADPFGFVGDHGPLRKTSFSRSELTVFESTALTADTHLVLGNATRFDAEGNGPGWSNVRSS